MSDQNGQQTTALATTSYDDERTRRAIALREDISQDATPRAIVPRTFAEAQSFAGAIATSSLVPDALRQKAPDVLMIVLAGAELGIAPIRALSMFHVMEGVPKLSADGLAAIVSASPLCEYLQPIEQSDERVVWEGKRKGRPALQVTWSDVDVKRANLDKPTRNGAASNHVKYPRAMKNARAKAELCHLLWPDLCAGIVTAEEARDQAATAEREAAPAFSAPASSTAAPANKAPAAGKAAAAAKSQPKPIDVAPASAGNSASAPSSSSAASNGSTTTSSAERPAGNGSDPAAKEALEAARRNASDIEKARAEKFAEEERKRAELEREQANTNDTTPSATPEDDSFGGDEAPAIPARTIEAFENLIADCVKSKDAARLEAVKADWMPWSKDEGPDGGRKHAHRMRDVFTKAKADLVGGR